MARTNVQQKLGQRIRILRKSLNLSQEKLGFKTNLNRTYISGIERGVRNPSLKNIEKLANALGVDVSELTNFKVQPK
jgi:transcriptional regulator with XRE-family HTH domain